MRKLLVLLAVATITCGTGQAAAGDDLRSHEITVRGTAFIDGYGREVVLRGFNVSGEVKLAEHGFLPFADSADARRSAQAMRALTGANAVRFPLSWAAAEPTRGVLDSAYLAAVTDQIKAFLDEGFAVLPDYHQDLYSRYLFTAGSWYSGDGAPKWVVDAGKYPPESCGICVHWGQNITQNGAVRAATKDFWHNAYGVQDEFLSQASATLTYLRTHLSAAEFAGIAGFDPYNEPYAGSYDQNQDSRAWERDLLWPFCQRFRQAMDAAGWTGKPAFVEPMASPLELPLSISRSSSKCQGKITWARSLIIRFLPTITPRLVSPSISCTMSSPLPWNLPSHALPRSSEKNISSPQRSTPLRIVPRCKKRLPKETTAGRIHCHALLGFGYACGPFCVITVSTECVRITSPPRSADL